MSKITYLRYSTYSNKKWKKSGLGADIQAWWLEFDSWIPPKSQVECILYYQHFYSKREVETGESAWSSWVAMLEYAAQWQNHKSDSHSLWKLTANSSNSFYHYMCTWVHMWVNTHAVLEGLTHSPMKQAYRTFGTKRKLLWPRSSKGTQEGVGTVRRVKGQLLQGASSHGMVVKRLKQVTAHHYPKT